MHSEVWSINEGEDEVSIIEEKMLPVSLNAHESILTLNKKDQISSQIKDILSAHNMVGPNTKNLV